MKNVLTGWVFIYPRIKAINGNHNVYITDSLSYIMSKTKKCKLCGKALKYMWSNERYYCDDDGFIDKFLI